MSIRDAELITPIDMPVVAESFLQAAFDGQVAVGQAQYYLRLENERIAKLDAELAADDAERAASKQAATEGGPRRSTYEKQLIAEHAAAMALAEATEKPQTTEEPVSGYTFGRSASAYSPGELEARISQARRAHRMPWLNVVDYGQDRLFVAFYGRSTGLGRL